MSTINQPNGSTSSSSTTERILSNPILATPITTTKSLIDTHILPPPRRSALQSAIQSHPFLSSFLLFQLLFSAIPIVIFLSGVAITASIAASVFACFAFLVLGPVLVFTTLLGVWVWGFTWVVVFAGRWIVGALGERGYTVPGVGAVKAEDKNEEGVGGGGEGMGKNKEFVVEEREVAEY